MSNRLLIISSVVLLMACSKQDHSGNIADAPTVRSKEPLPNPEVLFTDSVQMVKIDEGAYTPLFGSADSTVQVKAFLIDVYPVTNIQFRTFVQLNPQWRRSNVKRIYADANYLADWQDDTTLAEGADPEAPVTNVSWFAAKAYSHCVGKRLPSVDEWEYVASADKYSIDARRKKSYNQYILSWYEKPKSFIQPVGNTQKNYWGIWDLHGLVWEWTLDFNSVMLSGESRRDVSNDDALFCGSGSVGANDLMNYAAFMRYAFRGSLKANYCTQNQGFRCAKQVD